MMGVDPATLLAPHPLRSHMKQRTSTIMRALSKHRGLFESFWVHSPPLATHVQAMISDYAKR
jgi:hypothetical protein